MVLNFLHLRDELRHASPLVQCLTNSVAMPLSANVLLAAGASPAMIDTPEESGEFAAVASGVLINVGTPSAERYRGMREAVRGARDAGTPWVIDPVGAGALAHRTAFVTELLDAAPTALRGNASEIAALGGHGAGGRGVDSADTVDDALPAAQALAARTGGVVAVSGEDDLIVDPARITRLSSGHPLLTLVSGSGCSLGALCAAYLGLGVDKHDAVLAAHAHAGAAAQIAARSATGPGGFAVAWLDALHHITSAEIADLVTWKDLS
ncbi:MAG: hydroxyethylthiazole kinase [Corynebacterium sp.]|uniref:hydroxyethylthiazole kinase n=1 Tax=Corynebacterium sp. TaxID=1720 RepID=UPI0026DFA875|nr:hydroxyethylthiazole kinase [Corynebacterium sp.]MDO5670577.1 hydroxyethylthiazole kinase [Corynebacterium sp.]